MFDHVASPEEMSDRRPEDVAARGLEGVLGGAAEQAERVLERVARQAEG